MRGSGRRLGVRLFRERALCLRAPLGLQGIRIGYSERKSLLLGIQNCLRKKKPSIVGMLHDSHELDGVVPQIGYSWNYIRCKFLECGYAPFW